MTFVGTRDDAELLLSRSLSRHIGYTSGAYDLERIFSTLEPFSTQTSVYKEELVQYLAEPKSDKYRREILSFATSMGLLEVVSSREAGLVRLAATELGRSLLGVRATGDMQFYNYFSIHVVLRADADFLVPLLLYFRSHDNTKLLPFFAAFQAELRQRRLEWLLQTFPEKILMDRIVERLTWLSISKSALGSYEADLPTMNTVRHHATPRQGWLEQLGMLDRDKRTLTVLGSDVLRALTPDGGFFWLAPPEEALETLRIASTSRPAGAREDTLNFSVPSKAASESELNRLVEDTSSIMIETYGSAKLIHASQASLQIAVKYINYRSYVDRRKYNVEDVFSWIFREKRGILERYSAHKGSIGFYRVVNNR